MNDLVIWQNVFKHDDLWDFALVAMRLITAAVGEGDVECLFSIHRRLVGTSMTNIVPDVLLTRLRISTASSDAVTYA